MKLPLSNTSASQPENFMESSARGGDLETLKEGKPAGSMFSEVPGKVDRRKLTTQICETVWRECTTRGVTDEVETDEVDYGKMKVVELRTMLKERGGDVKGKKEELVQRLQAMDDEGVSEESEMVVVEEEEGDAERKRADYGKMKVVELRTMLKERGGDVKGKKEELVQRLQAMDDEDSQDPWAFH